MSILFKKKTSLGASNSKINGEWGSQNKFGKTLTSGKRRMIDKELIKQEYQDSEIFQDANGNYLNWFPCSL
jgi:hypothetical protein